MNWFSPYKEVIQPPPRPGRPRDVALRGLLWALAFAFLSTVIAFSIPICMNPGALNF